MAGMFPGQRKGWTTNSINPMPNYISAALAEQVRLGRLVRDVAALVSRDKRPKRKLTTFTPGASREDAAACRGEVDLSTRGISRFTVLAAGRSSGCDGPT